MDKLVKEEVQRIVDEVCGGLTPVESLVVRSLIIEITNNVGEMGLPTKITRSAYEILYKYMSVIEGLKK